MEKKELKSAIQDFLKSKEKLNNTHEGLVLFIHFIMLGQGFRLVGLSEKDQLQDFKELPKEWNKSQDVYTLKYKHTQSSLTFLIKCVPISSNLIITSVALEDPKPVGIELNCINYIKGNDLNQLNDYFTDLNKLEELFINQIISKLLPTKEEEKKQEKKEIKERQEIDINDPLRIGPIRRPNNNFIPSFGESDLYPTFPLGGPRFGIGGGGGNLMGPNDLLNQRNRPNNGNRPNNVPQGARFDPFGPTGNISREPEPDHLQIPRQRRRNEDEDDFDNMFL